MKHWIYPPKLPPDEEIEIFADGLKRIIPQKLKECLKSQMELKKERKEKLRLILKHAKRGSVDEYFWKTAEAAEFSEFYVIQKWIGYWLALWSKATKEKVDTKKFDKFEDFEIQKAKEYPFEQLITSQWRKSGKNILTLCLFHTETKPSFTIFPDNKAKCFGCDWSGSTIDFIMQTQNLTFPEAVRRLL